MFVERLDERAQEGAIAPVGEGGEGNADDLAERDPELAVPGEHQRFAGGFDALGDVLDLAAGLGQLLVVGVRNPQLFEKILEVRLELALAVRGVRLVHVQIDGQRLAGRLRELLELLDVTMSDHRGLPS